MLQIKEDEVIHIYVILRMTVTLCITVCLFK